MMIRRPTRQRITATLVVLLASACNQDTQDAVPGTTLWIKNLDGTDADSLRFVVDRHDDVTLAAYNRGVVDLGDGDRGDDDTLRDLLVARYRSPEAGKEPDLAWSRAIDGLFANRWKSRIGLAVDIHGDILISVSDAALDHDDDPETTFSDLTVANVRAGTLLKLSGEDGSTLWIRHLRAGDALVIPNDLALNDAGDVVLTGSARVVYDSGDLPRTTPGPHQLFVGVYASADGAHSAEPYRQLDAGFDVWGSRLAVSPTSHYHVVGAAKELPPATEGNDRLFFRKLAENYSDAWTPIEASAFAGELELAVDFQGYPLVAGSVALEDVEDMDPDNLAFELQIVKMRVDGSRIQWFWTLGDEKGISGKLVAAGLCTDADDNVLVAGSFRGKLRYSEWTLFAAESDALFVLKMASEDGEAQWGRYSGGTGDVIAAGVQVDTSGTVVAGGVFVDRVTAGDVNPASQASQIFLLALAP